MYNVHSSNHDTERTDSIVPYSLPTLISTEKKQPLQNHN